MVSAIVEKLQLFLHLLLLNLEQLHLLLSQDAWSYFFEFLLIVKV